jgi:predicted nucleotidyltransferase
MTQMAREAQSSEIDDARAREVEREVAKLARALLGANTQVIWFGSWPRQNALAHSDIDLAISIATPIPLERLALLHDAVDDIATLYQIDLVDLCSASPVLREEVQKHGERL